MFSILPSTPGNKLFVLILKKQNSVQPVILYVPCFGFRYSSTLNPQFKKHLVDLKKFNTDMQR